MMRKATPPTAPPMAAPDLLPLEEALCIYIKININTITDRTLFIEQTSLTHATYSYPGNHGRITCYITQVSDIISSESFIT